MMFPSHLLATLLGCALLSLARPLEPRDWLLALLFGVAIDLDHLLQIPRYIATHGWTQLDPRTISHWGADWQGFMHTPWALLILLPATLYFWSWIPLAAWTLHMILDFIVAKHYVHFGGPLEYAIMATMTAALIALALRDHRLHGAERALREHVLSRVAMIWTR